MRKKICINFYNIVFGIVVAALLAGCGAKGPITVEESVVNSEDRGDQRGFDPLEIPGDRTIVPSAFPIDASLQGKISVDSDIINMDTVFTDMVADVPDEIDSLNSQAYRVQLFSSKVYGEARSARKIAEEIFDRPLFLDYEVPYYKLRVGNFVDREKAEKYQQRAKAAGYKNAWVVMVIINKQSAPPLYEGDSLYLELPDTEETTGSE